MSAHVLKPYMEQTERQDFHNQLRIILILWLLIVIIPNIIELHTHYLEYQAFLSPGTVTKFIISAYQDSETEESRRLVDEEAVHMTELSNLLPQTNWGGLTSSLLLFGKKCPIQYRAVIHYQTGWATLYISDEEIYLYLSTPSAYWIKIDNSELHNYIWVTYCSCFEE